MSNGKRMRGPLTQTLANSIPLTEKTDERTGVSLAAALGEGTTKPVNVVKVDKLSSFHKFDVTREEHWGGPLSPQALREQLAQRREGFNKSAGFTART